jgi:hypothetical protein
VTLGLIYGWYMKPHVVVKAPTFSYVEPGADVPSVAGYTPSCDLVCNSNVTRAVKAASKWKGGVSRTHGAMPDAKGRCECVQSRVVPWLTTTEGLITVPIPPAAPTASSAPAPAPPPVSCSTACNSTTVDVPQRSSLQSMGYSGSLVAAPGLPLTAPPGGTCYCAPTNAPLNFAAENPT